MEPGPSNLRPSAKVATECLEIMQSTARGIGEMPVIDREGRPLGMLNLKDLLKAGIV